MTREEEASAATGMVQSSDLLVEPRVSYHLKYVCAGSITWYDGDSSKALEEAHFITFNTSDYFELVSEEK